MLRTAPFALHGHTLMPPLLFIVRQGLAGLRRCDCFVTMSRHCKYMGCGAEPDFPWGAELRPKGFSGRPYKKRAGVILPCLRAKLLYQRLYTRKLTSQQKNQLENICKNRYTDSAVAAGFPVFVGFSLSGPYIRRCGARNTSRSLRPLLWPFMRVILS